jgi:hypothetical protein
MWYLFIDESAGFLSRNPGYANFRVDSSSIRRKFKNRTDAIRILIADDTATDGRRVCKCGGRESRIRPIWICRGSRKKLRRRWNGVKLATEVNTKVAA